MNARLAAWCLLSAWCVLFPSHWVSAQDPSAEEVEIQLQRALDLRKQGKYAEGALLYEQLLPSVERLYGKDSTDTALALKNLALTYNAMGRYAKAEPLFQRSLQIREVKFGKDHPTVAESLNNLASLYYDMEQYGKAEPFYQRSLKIYEEHFGKDDSIVAAALNNLAVLYKVQGHYAQAAPLYQRSLEIWEARLGKEHPRVASALNNLANLYFDMGQYAKAEPLYQRSLQIREEAGKTEPEVAQSLNNLATLYKAQGRYAQAEEFYQKSLRLYEDRFSKDHPEVAKSLNNLAHLYYAMGEHAKTEPLCQRSLAICEASFGKTHDSVANIYKTQADIAWAKKETDRAIALLQQAIEIYRARLGKNHPSTNQAMSRLAFFYHQTQRGAEAIRTVDRSLRALRNHTAQVLPILPESEQVRFMTTAFKLHFHDAVSYGLDPRLNDENRLLAAGWLLNGKSIMHQALVERLLLARDNQSADAKRLLGELDEVRRKLARMNLNGPVNADIAAFRKDVEALRDREKNLEGQLHTTGLVHRDDPWIDIDELRQKLPAGAVYVDFLRFAPTDFTDPYNPSSKKLPPIYVAMTSSRDNDTIIVNLGSAEKMDDAIREVRKELQRAHNLIKQEGEIDAEKVLLQKLTAVSKLLLEPLLPHLKRYPQWILGPDGNLWLIPWASLPLDDKQYVIEKHTLRYVTSGRDLVLNPLQLDHKPSAPAIFADPDFDLEPVGAVPEKDSPEKLRNLSFRSPRRFGKVGRLLGTAAEAEAITPALESWAGIAPRRFLEAQASVTAFQQLKGPRVLVMSTHGYFLPDQEVPKQVEKRIENREETAVPGLENPLLRSGLLLAGCNHASKTQQGQATGVLTELEIVGTDLRGTELVVLSACETGLGEVRNGEGVAGLRQAFQLAGAQTVVASLWQIPDRETAILMKQFFEKMSAGQNKVHALHEAQLSMLRERRERNGAGHPFYWAAFTLTGR